MSEQAASTPDVRPLFRKRERYTESLLGAS